MQWFIGLKTKSIRAEWPKWRNMIKTQYGDLLDNVIIKHMKFDNAKEFLDSIIQKSMEEEGILVDLTVAYAHNQNGVAERAFQDIVNHAVSILSEAGLPLNL
jgi:transposase-like protein